jgi:hypothetical protein
VSDKQPLCPEHFSVLLLTVISKTVLAVIPHTSYFSMSELTKIVCIIRVSPDGLCGHS